MKISKTVGRMILINFLFFMQIKQYAEEILIHLLKGKFLFNEAVWRQFLESVIPALPLLQCHADQTTPLGRAVVKIFDPETSQSIHLPIKEVRNLLQ